MPVAWRIVKQKHSLTAFTGDGAAKFSGRWNSRGVPVVYVSSSRALAALEILVHLAPPVRYIYVAISVEFDESFIERVALGALAQDWKDEPPGHGSRDIGDSWIRERRSAVLQVPSVLIPGEPNFLLNPNHPDFNKLVFGAPEPFSFDPRLRP